VSKKKRLNAHLSKNDLKVLKDILMFQKERIINTQMSKKIQFSLQNENKDEVDSANDNILVSTDLRFSNREMLYLKKIQKSLNFIENEEFGMCQECGAEISMQRLKARPTSDMCINCKEESERSEHQNAHGRTSKSLGKEVKLEAGF
jgi:DnaK suppressor protein